MRDNFSKNRREAEQNELLSPTEPRDPAPYCNGNRGVTSPRHGRGGGGAPQAWRDRVEKHGGGIAAGSGGSTGRLSEIDLLDTLHRTHPRDQAAGQVLRCPTPGATNSFLSSYLLFIRVKMNSCHQNAYSQVFDV